MRFSLILGGAVAAVIGFGSAAAQSAPPILQQPTMSRELIAFVYGGDIWTVGRAGGRATRLTTGIGAESGPFFSPDGSTIAFTGEYDGNVDVFTVPATGGVPRRLTWHPAADVATGWSADGRRVLFRSNRAAASAYTQIFEAPVAGGPATALPLPMAFAGQVAPDGRLIAYTPLAPASGFELNRFVSWGNYRGGRASTIWLTSLPGLESVRVPHGEASDFSPVFLGGKVYFLSSRNGPASVFSYDPGAKQVAEVWRNTGRDLRTLATDGRSLIFDRLGELFLLDPGGEPRRVAVDVTGDMPDVRPRILNVTDQVQKIGVSPTGLRAVVEAHGEILTAPVKNGPVRNLTNTPGVMERQPAWSPDGQSVAYFSDESGVYALHIAPQAGDGVVRKLPIVSEPAYFFDPLWSPDSRKIAFRDNRLRTYVADLATGRVVQVGEPHVVASSAAREMAWSPDSRWLVYPHTGPNGLNVLMLWSAERVSSTPITDPLGDAQFPAFDRSGKQLYFLASNNAAATVSGLDMTSDLYRPTRSVYALTLKADTLSPTAPQFDDEKSPSEAKSDADSESDATPAGQAGDVKAAAKARPKGATKPVAPKITEIDLAALPLAAIVQRTVALPIPARRYSRLSAGKPGTIFFLEETGETFRGGGEPENLLNRFTLEERKVEKVAERVADYELTADGEKLLVGTRPPGPPPADGPPRKPTYAVIPANTPAGTPPKPGDGALSLDKLEVRVDPTAEWAQMYREVWRLQRAYFYDPGFHGADLAAEERKLAPYAAAVLSRSDLNYVFQEMLTPLSVGHLRGSNGAVPTVKRVPGGLLGADYVIRDGRWCFGKIYTAGAWSPDVTAPLAQPGMNIREGECVLAIEGAPLTAATDIQLPLEGTAGRAITLRVGAASGQGARNVTVVPIPSEARLRNLDWIEGNRRKVDQLSGGRLAYVYLPDTGEGGFTNFNRWYFAQNDKQGAVIDERFNGGGQMADYIIEVLGRRLQGWWSPRYGAIYRTPAHSVLGPKVMIANEVSGSGGDALPWMFKYNGLGQLVGKRTWGGLVGVGAYPPLMDGAVVTSPGFGFFSPKGEWDVENHGVEPDVVVEQDPKAVAAGHDPQLEAAVAIALEKLKTGAPAATPRPAYPVYGRTAP